MGVGLLFLGALSSFASDDSIYNPKLTLQPDQKTQSLFIDNSDPDARFRNNEVVLEAFGVGTATGRAYEFYNGYAHHHHDLAGGGGAGLAFFFCKYVGIEGEAYSTRFFPNFVDNVGGNLVLRWPIANIGLAPYVFGGGGHQFNEGQATYADTGVGVEYRFNPMLGIFIDGRAVLPDNGFRNYGMGRLGLRFAF